MTNRQVFIQALINSQTDDEDIRQDLWVQYLSDPTRELSLEEAQYRHLLTHHLQNEFACFMIRPLSGAAEEAVAILAPIERKVLYFLLMCESLTTIAKYNNMTEVRVKQVIASIQRSPRWNDLLRGSNNAKEESN